MGFSLAPEAARAGYELAAFETIGSTSSEAMARLKAGAPAPLWVVSPCQVAGRGRRGSAWSTERGNLAASLGLILDAPPATIATLGFVAGVALVRASEAMCPPAFGEEQVTPKARTEVGVGPDGARPSSLARPDPNLGRASPDSTLPASGRADGRFTLKWPNDVLVEGAKLAGILLETEETARGRAVVIGIGVNVAHAPDDLPYPATSLRTLGMELSAEQLFEALSAAWVEVYQLWDGGAGFPAVREQWLARAAWLGRTVQVKAGLHLVSGTFETIDPHGQLVMRSNDGKLSVVSAGEVHFGEAATLRQEAAA